MRAEIALDPEDRVLYLTKDLHAIAAQIDGSLILRMSDLSPEDLLDDINTDCITPAWACFEHLPEALAANAYAGLSVLGKRLIAPGALSKGRWSVLVSGARKGVGSSRETAVQAELGCGIRIVIAGSFAPIYRKNATNLGLLCGDYGLLSRLEDGERIPFDEFTAEAEPLHREILRAGGLFGWCRALDQGRAERPDPLAKNRPMTMGEKIIARHLWPARAEGCVMPGDRVLISVDGGYSHEFTTAQVQEFLLREVGPEFTVEHPECFAVFEDHLVYADEVPSLAPHREKIERLRSLQRAFQGRTGVQDFSSRNGRSPGICHQVARERMILPGDLIQATDSHTCMGGGNNALAFGVGATEYAAVLHHGFSAIVVPESIRFDLHGAFRPGVGAKDLMLWILSRHVRNGDALDRIIEFTGPGLARMTMDERATLANMATECSAKACVVCGDEVTVKWLGERHPTASTGEIAQRIVLPDPDAHYAGGVHRIDLSALVAMVAHPGDPDRGIPSDPTNGIPLDEAGEVRIDIAYGGSCTAGKEDDLRDYAMVLADALDRGRKVADSVRFFIQFGSARVERVAADQGWIEIFQRAGVTLLQPGCGACIGCGPGVSTADSQVTISAINRNYRGRSGPGRLWLASPATVAMSSIEGRIAAWPGHAIAR